VSPREFAEGICKFDLHFSLLLPIRDRREGKKKALLTKRQRNLPPDWQRCRETPPLGPRMGALEGAPIETFFAKVVPVSLFVGLRRILAVYLFKPLLRRPLFHQAWREAPICCAMHKGACRRL
jgi:hypothetical protein